MPRTKQNPEGEQRYNVRFPLEVYAALKKAAEREGRSINQQIVHLLRRQLKIKKTSQDEHPR